MVHRRAVLVAGVASLCAFFALLIIVHRFGLPFVFTEPGSSDRLSLAASVAAAMSAILYSILRALLIPAHSPTGAGQRGRPRPNWVPVAVSAVVALAVAGATVLVWNLLRDKTPVLSRGEEAVPRTGTAMSIFVPAGELRVLTGGRMCIDSSRICFEGGSSRGSVVVLLPRADRYEVTDLFTGQNWLGYFTEFDGDERDYEKVAEDRVALMHSPGNCSPSVGCRTVDVLILGPDIWRQYESVAPPRRD